MVLYCLKTGNNCIETIPAEIGLLVNLVELSVGGNQLVRTVLLYCPSDAAYEDESHYDEG